MKKLLLSIVLLFAVVAVVNAQNEATKTFNLKMAVDEYIEIGTCPQCLDFGITNHSTIGVSLEQLLNASKTIDEFAYANCKFSITVSGTNDKGELYPRFVRKEVGPHGGAFDVLPTQHEIHLKINGAWILVSNSFHNSSDFPFTYNVNEAPHNGQIKFHMYTDVNRMTDGEIPIRATVIDRNYTNDQSADAGEYKCEMTTTLTAI